MPYTVFQSQSNRLMVMDWITLLPITGFLFLVLLGAAGYLLCVASGRASEREARVAEMLRNAKNHPQT